MFIDSEGEVVFYKDIKTRPDALMIPITTFLDDLVIAVALFSHYNYLWSAALH
jgi:hypothetical protein